ncbi:hypothetical protein PC113_g7893 [Phytophthora cactorum]|uniref:Uncharacterized protein n=1 Tax=Phytophthora cactorum TaxID=29920 RepID=A0A8T0ZE57_9STRA|nr:hypothetical protein PC113_g7893 [Phytophthora cactorum]
MRRIAFMKIHNPGFEAPENSLIDMSERITQWPKVMIQTIRDPPCVAPCSFVALRFLAGGMLANDCLCSRDKYQNDGKEEVVGNTGYTWSTRLPPSPFHAIHQGRAQDRWRADTAPEVQQRGNYIVLTPLRRSNIVVLIVYGVPRGYAAFGLCRYSLRSKNLILDKVPGHDFTFMVAGGYDVLLEHIKRVFDTTNGLTWEESVSVYVKPTNHAPQKDYIPVATDSTAMEAQFATIWHTARLRKHGHAAFVLMLYVYVSRPRAQRLTSLRRATDGRIQEQLPRVAAYMREHSIEGGPASQRYAAVSQVRLPDDAPVQVPDYATMRQLRFIDEQERAMDHDQVEQQRRCDALGLPQYSLRPPHRDSLQLETPDPAVDMVDIDHGGETER